MKNINFKQSFKNKHFKKGSYSAGLIVIVLVIALVLNMLVKQMPKNWTTKDLSPQKLYTISNTSKKIIKNLKKDVTIYQISESGKEDSYIQKLLDKYKSYSDHIIVKTLDPEISPGLLNQYNATSLSDNSLIVISGDKSKNISYDDIYEQDASNYYTTGTSSYNYDGEGEITSAVNYVTTENLPIMYTLTGHGEKAFADSIAKSITKQNITTTSLNLLNSEIPEDCGILAIIAPNNDCNSSESQKIISYLKSGGKALIIMQYNGTELKNFNSIIAEYGLSIDKGFVCESNKNYYVDNGYYLLPTVENSDITESICKDNLYVLIPFAESIKKAENTRQTEKITDLLTTTEDAYLDVDYGKDGSYKKDVNDPSGAYSLGVSVEETVNNKTTQLVLFSSYNMFLTQVVDQYTLGNTDLITNSLSWMSGSKTNISIPTKSLNISYNTVSKSKANLYTIIFCVMIPLTVITLGFITWFKRRKA